MMHCLSFAQLISISGNAQTEDGTEIQDVEVIVSGDGLGTFTTTTDNDGNFSIAGLPDNQEYRVCMDKDIEPLNGVTTFDMVLISQHILGVQLFSSPYQIIAADVSNNKVISVRDMTETRKVILFINNRYPDVPSWRFIPADHVFPILTNPFSADFPERCKCVTANGNVTGVDFIAIKMGDVNDSAAPN